jgi:hypothetical protein
MYFYNLLLQTIHARLYDFAASCACWSSHGDVEPTTAATSSTTSAVAAKDADGA